MNRIAPAGLSVAVVLKISIVTDDSAQLLNAKNFEFVQSFCLLYETSQAMRTWAIFAKLFFSTFRITEKLNRVEKSLDGSK